MALKITYYGVNGNVLCQMTADTPQRLIEMRASSLQLLRETVGNEIANAISDDKKASVSIRITTA